LQSARTIPVPFGLKFKELLIKVFSYICKKIDMIIERTNSEIIIRLPGDINIDELQDMTDWFQYKEITRKSKAKQSDVDNLVNQIKKGRWSKRKAILIK
jgi:hypothetical protein